MSKVGSSVFAGGKGASIFVRIYPTPSSLSERRSVLQTLQKYGEIQVFKKLGSYDQASFISVTSKIATAEALIQDSPLQFDYVPTKPQYIHDMPLSAALPPPPVPSFSNTTVDPSSQRRKTFIVHVFQAIGYQHKKDIRAGELHGPWPGTRKNVFENGMGFAEAALRRSVPRGMSWRGLSGWEAERAVGEDEATRQFDKRMGRRRVENLLGVAWKEGDWEHD